MNRFGFIRAAVAVPIVRVADAYTNSLRVCKLLDSAEKEQAALALFPRLCLTGATCGNLLRQQNLQEATLTAVDAICNHSKGMKVTAVVSAVLQSKGSLRECNIVINDGEIKCVIPEGEPGTFTIDGTVFSFSVANGGDIVLCPVSPAESIESGRERKSMLEAMSRQMSCAILYAGSGYGESTTDNAFCGSALIYENGEMLTCGEDFSTQPQLIVADIDVQLLRHLQADGQLETDDEEALADIEVFPDTAFSRKLHRPVNPSPFTPREPDGYARAFAIQTVGLASRMESIGCRKIVIGISGGLDSTLALLCAVNTFDRMKWDRKGITGVTMPGFGTSGRTHGNAVELMKELGISWKEIDISASCLQHLRDIGHDCKTQDVTYENAQARERTQILMDIANMENAIVLGTGDLSELALGWCTYNGDQMSNYSVNASIPKTLVRQMVTWASANVFTGKTGEILRDIVATPVSPELKGGGGKITQKTEDLIGPYELHDFFIYNFIHCGFQTEKIEFLAVRAFKGRFRKEEIHKWLDVFVKRFFSQQFKRSASPDGAAVTCVSLSPREGWPMPSDASSNCFR